MNYYTDYDFFAKAVKIFEEHENDSEIPLVMVCANALEVNEITGLEQESDIGRPGRVKGMDFFLKPDKYHKPLSVFPTLFNGKVLRQVDFNTYSMGDGQLYQIMELLGDAWFMPDVIGVHRIHGENERFGVKNNPEYYKRIPVGRIKDRNTRLLVYKTIYERAGKKASDLWWINRWYAKICFYRLQKPGFRKIFKSLINAFKDSGFMPRLWIILPLKVIIISIKDILRHITPLRRLYKKIKYGDSHYGE